jgi:DNA-binding NtrC family response regulator
MHITRRPESTASKRSVLLVEDSEPLRTVVARSLRRAGFEVVEASDGYEALTELSVASCHNRRFHLVISDVRLPGYDGLNLLVAIRKLDPPIPAIIITAFGSETLHSTARRIGAVATLNKPFALADLIDLARNATEDHES